MDRILSLVELVISVVSLALAVALGWDKVVAWLRLLSIRRPRPKVATVTLYHEGAAMASTEIALLPPPRRPWQFP